MKACMEQSEYAGKTFGVISLLGADQARYIETLISQDEDIDAKEIEERRILCGDSSNFQGDERDVIFLSIVDSPSDPATPLSLQGFGVQDSTRKRYNVAASRARDQLWVIHSLDHNVNLKAGDIRKDLIEYALNPSSITIQQAEVTARADSEFEVQVAMKLKTCGYHIVQQWEVGAYRIDMVAVCGDKKIAIECDGDRYHSSPSQVRNDMERQTILERIGWTFIRIRGSEYFRQPEKTIEQVVTELKTLGIQPEAVDEVQGNVDRDTELLDRVKQRAAIILHPELAEAKESEEIVPEKVDEVIDETPAVTEVVEQEITSSTDKANSSIETTLYRVGNVVCD
jgi:very-short-patch-repair endonuclease